MRPTLCWRHRTDGRERKRGQRPVPLPAPPSEAQGQNQLPACRRRQLRSEALSCRPSGSQQERRTQDRREPQRGPSFTDEPPPAPSASRTDPENRTDLGTHGLETANRRLSWNLMRFTATPRNTNILQRILAGPRKQPHTIQTVQDPIHIYST